MGRGEGSRWMDGRGRAQEGTRRSCRPHPSPLSIIIDLSITKMKNLSTESVTSAARPTLPGSAAEIRTYRGLHRPLRSAPSLARSLRPPWEHRWERGVTLLKGQSRSARPPTATPPLKGTPLFFPSPSTLSLPMIARATDSERARERVDLICLLYVIGVHCVYRPSNAACKNCIVPLSIKYYYSSNSSTLQICQLNTFNSSNSYLLHHNSP